MKLMQNTCILLELYVTLWDERNMKAETHRTKKIKWNKQETLVDN